MKALVREKLQLLEIFASLWGVHQSVKMTQALFFFNLSSATE
jgi:hypothetical protein